MSVVTYIAPRESRGARKECASAQNKQKEIEEIERKRKQNNSNKKKMSNNLYGKTTESLESLQAITCTTKFKACGTGGNQNGSSSTDSGGKKKKKKNKNKNKSNMDQQDGRGSGGNEGENSLDAEMERIELEEQQQRDDDQSIGMIGPDYDSPFDQYGSNADVTIINQPGKPRLSRAKSVRETIVKGAKGTLDFFGIPESENTADDARQKWEQRKIRHLSRIGRLKESVSVPTTPDQPDGIRSFATLVDYTMQRSYMGHLKKRENAAKMLWKSASRRLSARPQYDVSTIQSFGGRSFAPADLLDDEISVFGSVAGDERKSITPTPTPQATTPSFLDAQSFFHFDTHYPSTIEEEDSQLDYTDGGPSGHGLSMLGEAGLGMDTTDGGLRPESSARPEYGGRYGEPSGRYTPSPEPSIPSTPTPQIISSWDKNYDRDMDRTRPWDKTLGPEPQIQKFSPSIHRKPAYQRQMSDRRSRLAVKPPIKKKIQKKVLKREFGKGLVGNLLNRTFNRSRMNSRIEKQMEDISDHRPYFTYWLSFVQIVILIVMVSIYPFAPVGISQKSLEKEEKGTSQDVDVKNQVLLSRNGVLQKEVVQRKIVESFWIGPSLGTLISLGAKYAPCMRYDKLLYGKLKQERLAENKTGCCIGSFNDGCIQRDPRECTSSFTTFKPQSVCGQHPKACLNPVSKAPNEWSKDITEWPEKGTSQGVDVKNQICRKTRNISSLDREKYPEMRCKITGRPCCVGTQAHCVITTQNYCQYLDGVYHPEKTLCSQVDCLASTCGMLPFLNDDQPDQVYRLWLSLFLNAGLLHLLIILIFNFTILRDIEKMAGCLRTALIFLLSGICGNLWSSILVPYEPEVGPSGAAFGIIACLFVEVIQSWQLVREPWIALGKLCGIILVLFLLGLLPYIDNFAHIFGFIHGFFLALIFLPFITFGAWDRKRKIIQVVASVFILSIMTIVGFILFYVTQDINTSGVTYFNCIPITEDFCKNFHQGQSLEDRLKIY